MDSPPVPRPATPAHTQPPDVLLRALGSSAAGLTGAAATAALASAGPNEVRRARGRSAWAILGAQFANLLTIILLVATALSALLGHGIEAVAITVIVLFSVGLGFIQEYRAGRALDALREMAAPGATVVREGREVLVPARDVVPGDLLVLHAGDRVAADARLVEAVNLGVQEAALTGESVPVGKHTEVLPDPVLPLGDRRNMVFAGTSVSRGRGQALVVATGMATEFGRIAHLLETVEARPTPLQENLQALGRTLARAALAVVAVIVALGVARGQPLVEMLVFGVALAVAVVPEVLPAVVTISLAVGVQRLVRRRALMRQLPAVETLGSTSVICSDKTGTLTRNEMTVRQAWVAGQPVEVTGTGYRPEGEFLAAGQPVTWSGPGASPLGGPLERLLTTAVLASDARLVHEPAHDRWTIQGDPTEAALVVAAAKAGWPRTDLDLRHPRLQEIPFSAESMRMTTLHRAEGTVRACVKGAPEVILAACDRQELAGGEAPLDAESREALLAVARRLAAEGQRVLAVATREGATLENVESGLTFLGLVAIMDPPRPEARAALERCRQAGIRVVMITGDHPLTAEAVAGELGLLGEGRVVTGAELDQLSDEDLGAAIDGIAVFARVAPAHKVRVVTALQARGEVVAMTGDGVNDAPALKQADIGVAMGVTGTDVAREAAAMTLTDDNFASIVAAVEEGRGIFGNIRKYLMFLLSSNIGEIGLMAAATLAGLPMPLTAVQILYVNLATDGLPALALSVDPPEGDLMQRRPRHPRAGVFTRPVVTLMLVGGAWSALANLALFVWALRSGRSLPEAMTLTFASLVLIQFVKAYAFRSDRRPLLDRPWANRWLNRAVAWELALLGVVVQWPALHGAFGTTGLAAGDWALVAAVALTVAPVLELAKWLARRGRLGPLD